MHNRHINPHRVKTNEKMHLGIYYKLAGGDEKNSHNSQSCANAKNAN